MDGEQPCPSAQHTCHLFKALCAPSSEAWPEQVDQLAVMASRGGAREDLVPSMQTLWNSASKLETPDGKQALLLQTFLYYICAHKGDACSSPCSTGWAILWYALFYDTSRLLR